MGGILSKVWLVPAAWPAAADSAKETHLIIRLILQRSAFMTGSDLITLVHFASNYLASLDFELMQECTF